MSNFSINSISGSCVDFGLSGSGVVREWKVFSEATGPSLDFGTKIPNYQYSFVGPLSLSKGCDQALYFRDIKNNSQFLFRGANPMVVTDATCFMPWIAAQYGLSLPRDYKVKDSCTQSTGNRDDINKEDCM